MAWESEWKEAKITFENLTGSKKPAHLVFGGMIRKGSGVEDALHKCDSAFSRAEVNTTQGKVDIFVDAVGKSAPIISNYCAFLEEEIEKAPNKSTHQKALVMLRKTLEAIRYTMESQIGMLTSKLKHEPIKQAMASNFSLSLRAAVARARVFAAMVDLNAVPQTFNHGIKDAARDITQQIGNVDKLRAAGFAVPPGDPAKLFKELTPFAQDKIKMEPYATAMIIRQHTDMFSRLVERVAKMYGMPSEFAEDHDEWQ